VEDPSARSDNELIDLSLRGNTAAFGALVLRYRKLVIGTAYRVCGDAVLAEDIAQDTFVRVWDRLSTYRPQGTFRGWVCRIASNMTIDALRRQKPTVDIDMLSLTATSGRPEAVALQNERAIAVRSAIIGLPVQTRVALVLREYQDFSYQEIAQTLDIPMGTVKSRLSDARRRLRDALTEFVEG